jgi:hypothetical protein
MLRGGEVLFIESKCNIQGRELGKRRWGMKRM